MMPRDPGWGDRFSANFAKGLGRSQAALDPDPLTPLDYERVWADGYDAGWQDAPRVVAHRRGAGIAVAILVGLAFGIGLFVGVRVALAAPRTAAQPVIPAGPTALLGSWAGIDQGSSGNLAERPSGAPPSTMGDRRPGPGVVVPPPGRTQSAPALRGVASWCAPTPRHCQGWAPPAKLGAMASFRFGDRPYLVRVTSGRRHVDVLVVSFCACGTHLIDLSPAAFRELAPLPRGVVRVTVRRLSDPKPPATDR